MIYSLKLVNKEICYDLSLTFKLVSESLHTFYPSVYVKV